MNHEFLTRRELKLLRFIEVELTKSGISPSFDEMRVHINLKSKGHTARIINGLEAKGYIRRLHNRSRAIEIVKPEEGVPAEAQYMRLVRALAAPVPASIARAERWSGVQRPQAS